MVAIFCRHSKWSNSFYPLGSPDSLTRQSEKRSNSSFEKSGEVPMGPCGHRSASSTASIKDPPCSQEQPRRRCRPSTATHLPSRTDRHTRLSRRYQRFKSEKCVLKCFVAIRLRGHFAARAARGDFVSSFSSPWPRQTPERDGTLVW